MHIPPGIRDRAVGLGPYPYRPNKPKLILLCLRDGAVFVYMGVESNSKLWPIEDN